MSALDFTKPLINDDGLVCGTEVNSSCSNDIFDASEWWGGEEEGKRIAAIITNGWNGALESKTPNIMIGGF